MGRKATPQPLTISPSSLDDDSAANIEPGPKSAPSLRSPRSPRSPFRFSTKLGHGFGDPPSMQATEEQERRRNFSSSPATPAQATFQKPFSSDRQESRDRRQEQDSRPSTSPAKGGFFSNYKASKSSSRLQSADSTRQGAEETMSRGTDRPPLSAKIPSSEGKRRDPSVDKSITRRPVGSNSRSDLSLPNTTDSDPAASTNPVTTTTTPSTSTPTPTPTGKRGKPKPFSLLRRPSIRVDGASPGPETAPIVINEPDRAQAYGMKTAPLRVADHDRSFRDIMSSSSRNRSADRQPHTAREAPFGREHRDGRGPTSFRENGGQGFLNNLKNSSSKAVNMSRGFLNKVGRSGSTNEREPLIDDEHYVLKVINKPLVDQTRLTRISKRLEDSRDKTEFWMPSFPWRAIDYLNFRGTETEGLYRVPGSGPQIKKWQRRFDEELDIDLFEQEDLYDINIIGSMLKAWLRELPDELFPKASQDKVAKECTDHDHVPQVLIDELSNLPPFNYYLLFAITCHLSLLLAHSAKNKMDFRNLCICFQPCMKIDMVCFKFLVVDWRDCWKGCKTEDEWIAKEYAVFDQLPPSSGEGRSSTAVESHDERNVSSSDSSKPPSVSLDNSAAKGSSRSKPQNISISQSNSSQISTDTSSTTQTLEVRDNRTPKSNGDLTLSPIQPLSPMTL